MKQRKQRKETMARRFCLGLVLVAFLMVAIGGFLTTPGTQNVDAKKRTYKITVVGNSLMRTGSQLKYFKQIAKLYNISLQDIVSEESKTTTSPVMESKLTNRFKFFIGLSSCILVLFIATFIYAVLFALKVDTSKAYLVFLYAIPVTCIVGLVFNWIWGNVLNNFWFASGISWGLIIAIYYTLNIKELWLLFVATAVFQVLIIVWFLQIKTKIQKEKLAKTNEKDSITNQITINDQNF